MLVAVTICFSVLAAGAAIALIEITSPGADTTQAAAAISDVINTLIGLLAGFLAGRTDAHLTIERLSASGKTTRLDADAGRRPDPIGEAEDEPARSGDV